MNHLNQNKVICFDKMQNESSHYISNYTCVYSKPFFQIVISFMVEMTSYRERREKREKNRFSCVSFKTSNDLRFNRLTQSLAFETQSLTQNACALMESRTSFGSLALDKTEHASSVKYRNWGSRCHRSRINNIY